MTDRLNDTNLRELASMASLVAKALAAHARTGTPIHPQSLERYAAIVAGCTVVLTAAADELDTERAGGH